MRVKLGDLGTARTLEELAIVSADGAPLSFSSSSSGERDDPARALARRARSFGVADDERARAAFAVAEDLTQLGYVLLEVCSETPRVVVV